MAEICVGMVSESKTQTKTCEPTTRAARRKRMEIRRFKIIAGVVETSTTPAENNNNNNTNGKRRKLDILQDYSWCQNAVDPNCVDKEEEEEEEGAGDSISQSSSTSTSTETTVWTSDHCSSVETFSTTLSTPPPAAPVKIESLLSDRCPKFGMSSVCGRRREMEDAVAICPSFCRRECNIPSKLHFFGVYDGHGCSHVAMSCRERMHQLVKEEIEISEASSSSSSSLEWKGTMERSFGRMDEEVLGGSIGLLNTTCRCELQKPQCDSVGSTAVVSVVTPEKIIVANCGDSRAVMCRGGKAVPLSDDHKPDRPDELLRIEEAGGRVIYWDGARVLGFLAMSRAIGDNYFKPYVISEPEVTITDRTSEDECLILASDGLWDVVSNEMACNIARMCLSGQGPSVLSKLNSSVNGQQVKTTGLTDGERSDKACSDAALLLTKLALARHSSDNVSVVVVDLRRRNS